MIATWMFASTIFALLLGLAATALERAMRGLGRQGRAPWLAALGVAVAWPIIAPLALRLFGARIAGQAPVALPMARSTVTMIVDALPSFPPAWLGAPADATLLVIWAVASIVLFARLLLAVRALTRVACSATPHILDGVPVLVTPALGPAVFGMRRPRMVMPRWLLELDASLRALVLRHEQEHCRARDPQLVIGAAIAVALVPWNAGAWWIARRLRLAVELDCDVRVLRASENLHRYGKLLLLIAQRQSQTRLTAMLAESTSHLSQRITAMNASRPARPIARAATFVLVAAGALALACSPRINQNLTGPTPTAGHALTNLSQGDGATYFEFQVEKPVRHASNSTAPVYPSILKRAGIEGEVLASFVVGADGRADPASFKVLKTSHELFAVAVRDAVPNMRFVPAEIRGRKVKQLLMQPFVFSLSEATGSKLRPSLGVLIPGVGTKSP